MPYPKNVLSRNFSRHASGLLTEVGHGRLLVVVDDSYDVPNHALTFEYRGNKPARLAVSAALTEIEDAYPLDETAPTFYMLPDIGDDEYHLAPKRNKATIKRLGLEATGLLREGETGFYAIAQGDDPTKPPLYCLTASDQAYDGVIAPIGNSQV